mmetsp:Transcript_29354/g.84054  ORF Transcript_29354/g.84054 Transcript_29354/m.84054 type:complete len:271 (+) Transcript_29354:361-1173(+)
MAVALHRGARAHGLPGGAEVVLEAVQGANVFPCPADDVGAAAATATHAVVRLLVDRGHAQVPPHGPSGHHRLQALLLKGRAVHAGGDLPQPPAQDVFCHSRVKADVELHDVVLARHHRADTTSWIILVGLNQWEVGADSRVIPTWSHLLKEERVVPWAESRLALRMGAPPPHLPLRRLASSRRSSAACTFDDVDVSCGADDGVGGHLLERPVGANLRPADLALRRARARGLAALCLAGRPRQGVAREEQHREQNQLPSEHGEPGPSSPLA